MARQRGPSRMRKSPKSGIQRTQGTIHNGTFGMPPDAKNGVLNLSVSVDYELDGELG